MNLVTLFDIKPLPRILWVTFKHSFVTPSSWGLKSLFLLFLPKFIAMRDTVHETDKTSPKFQEFGHSLESLSK